MIAVYYNPKKDEYYAKLLRSVFVSDNYKVGYINNYGHKIVCMFYLTEDKKLVACNSYWDYNLYKTSWKKRLIKRIIKFLERSVKL